EHALTQLASLGPGDTIFSVGNYTAGNAQMIAALKRRHGLRYVSMCHDLIPVRFPQFFDGNIVEDFHTHWLTVLRVADRVLVNSSAVERDIRDCCRAQGIVPGEIVRVRPGCNLAGVAPSTTLPAGLQRGRFALFVGTVEPRKGHAM